MRGHVRATVRHLVGREEELEAIVGFSTPRSSFPGAVVLPGEAGIGKTTVWLAGIDEAAGAATAFCRPGRRKPRPGSRSPG